MRTMKVNNITPLNTEQQPVANKIPEKPVTDKKIEVAVCIPMYNTCQANWVIHLMRFIMAEMKNYTLHIVMQEQQPVSQSREVLAQQAIDMNPDYILWLDSDNVIPTGALKRLIDTAVQTDADLVSALYFGKDAPHYPVIRKLRSGGFYKIENPALGQVIPIDGCGLGCCLMKPEIFKETEKPWFKFNHEKWGYKDIVLSEDLWFCRKLGNLGKKMICNTGVVSSHLGGAVDVMEYMNFAHIRQSTQEERDECIMDICEFLKLEQEEVDHKIMVGTKWIKEEWEDKNPQSDEEIKQFYKNTVNYLYDLTLWHFSERRRYDIELVTAITNHREKMGKKEIKVLDFGCGIGQNSYMIAKTTYADITLADLDSQTLDFAKFRFKKHGKDYKVWHTDIEDMPPEEKYDVILAFDVFEHLSESDTEKYIEKLLKVKKKDTKILVSPISSFGTQNGLHPMHYDMSEFRYNQIRRLLEEMPEDQQK